MTPGKTSERKQHATVTPGTVKGKLSPTAKLFQPGMDGDGEERVEASDDEKSKEERQQGAAGHKDSTEEREVKREPKSLGAELDAVTKSANGELMRQSKIYEYTTYNAGDFPQYPEAENQNWRKVLYELETTSNLILEKIKQADRATAEKEDMNAYPFIFADVIRVWSYRHEEWQTGITEEELLAGWVCKIPDVHNEKVEKVKNIFPTDYDGNPVGLLWCKVLLFQLEAAAVAPERLQQILKATLAARGRLKFEGGNLLPRTGVKAD
eukprot:558396-Rhodomonas_salina.1